MFYVVEHKEKSSQKTVYNSKSFMDEVSPYTSEMFIMGWWISVLFQSAVSIIRYISG